MRFANIAYIPIETALAIHDEQLKAHGGQAGIRNYAGLESAIAQPQAGYGDHEFYPTVFDKAAAYAFHISEAQAFVDGNKRTALVVALTFLAINGYSLRECKMDLYDAMIGVANREIDKEELSDIFRNLVIDSIS